MDLDKIELDILNLRTEGYVLSYTEIEKEIRNICSDYGDDIQKYIILSSTLYNKMWKNDYKMVYFKSDDNGHKKIVDIIYNVYCNNTDDCDDIDVLFQYDKDNKKNKNIVNYLNGKGWRYSY